VWQCAVVCRGIHTSYERGDMEPDTAYEMGNEKKVNKASNTVSFTVPGEARGKARPRVTRGGQHTYTPDPGGWTESVTAAAVAAREDPSVAEYTGVVSLQVAVDREMPKSLSKKKRGQTRYAPCLTKPDSNNVAGAIMDALNHVLYEDDSQVYRLSIRQIWADEHTTTITVNYF